MSHPGVSPTDVATVIMLGPWSSLLFVRFDSPWKVEECVDIRPHVCGAYFTDDFSIVIKIWWQIWFPLVQILINWSLQKCVHSMTSTLSCLVWKRVVIPRDDITAKRINRIWITKNISCQRNVIQGRCSLVFWKLICVATLMSNMICFR